MRAAAGEQLRGRRPPDAPGRPPQLGDARASVGIAGAAGAPDAVIEHGREVSGLRPGRYRLAAFVRDRVANVFGGAEALLDLPDPRRGGVAGPVMLAERALRLRSPLPLKGDPVAGRAGAEVRSEQDAGPAPVAPLPVRRGATLLFESWICPATGNGNTETVALVSRDEVPLFRVAERAALPAAGAGPDAPEVGNPRGGACARRVDEVPTEPLEVGPYLYVLRARTAGGAVESLPVPFVVAPGAPPLD